LAKEGGMSEQIAPIVIDLGKKKRKRIKDLKRGRGSVAREVLEATAQVRESFGDAASDKEFVPIVVVYRKKRKGGKMRFPNPF
jgi:hypothetical protein